MALWTRMDESLTKHQLHAGAPNLPPSQWMELRKDMRRDGSRRRDRTEQSSPSWFLDAACDTLLNVQALQRIAEHSSHVSAQRLHGVTILKIKNWLTPLRLV